MVFQQAGLALVQGEPDSEHGAGSGVVFQFNAPAVLPDNPLDNHQSQAGPFFLGREKRLKNMVDLLLGDAARCR
jgi:hypothetical protein